MNPAGLVQRIEFVTIETDPAVWRPTADDSGLDVPHLLPEWKALPERYATVLAELVDHDPGEPARCARCLTGVGYIERSREDSYGREVDTVEWSWVTLVADPDGGAVSVQCEGCAPEFVPNAA